MFQTWPVKIASTHASSRPMFERGKSAISPSTRPGMNDEHRDALPDVERRDQELLGPAARGGGLAVHDREDEREEIGREPARERQQRIAGRAFGSRSIGVAVRIGAFHRCARTTTPPTSAASVATRKRSTATPAAPPSGAPSAVVSSAVRPGRRMGTAGDYPGRCARAQRGGGDRDAIFEKFLLRSSNPLTGSSPSFPFARCDGGGVLAESGTVVGS